MKTQRKLHHADTYFRLSHVQRTPRSRAQDRFAISRHVMLFTPPMLYGR